MHSWFERAPVLYTPDALPALAVGGVLSLAAVRAGQHRWLFGIWMSLYGVAQAAYRRSLPAGICGVGLAYVACGAACLLLPPVRFLDPWPMGWAFFLGELAGGAILLKHDAGVGDDEDERRRAR